MRIATLLFVYNRSYHTEQVLTSLKQNSVLPEKLFIFQDGQKFGCDSKEWNKVNALINAINWCDKEIHVSAVNKGLATSIISGINYVFEKYDAVIVLEDDCVPAVNFISFMNQCFEKYEKDENVYSVSGYAYPVNLKKGKYDIYGCGRISSWGWGTWKNRWDTYEKDYEFVKRMKKEEKASKNLAIWGRDLEEMLIGNVRGNCDSWAVFWALGVILRNGVCINPYVSLIKNIGLDGTGEHCSVTDKFDVALADTDKEIYDLPDTVPLLQETIEKLVPLFGLYTAVMEDDPLKEDILVYGAGNFFIENEKSIIDKYNIKAFVDREKRGWFAGKRIIRPSEIKDNQYSRILIMVKDIYECEKIVEYLISLKIDREKILIGYDLIEKK